MTRLLFVHQNMPGQYREMVDVLRRDPAHELVFLTQRKNAPVPDGVRKVLYAPHRIAKEGAYGLSRIWEDAAGTGYGAALACKALRDKGFTPDIILGHTGWGELLFLKHIWPDTPILGFFEYYYLLHGGPVNFDPEVPASKATPFLLQARNAVPNAAIHAVDRGTCPTRWQRDTFPPLLHPRLYVAHDGIRTDRLGPDPGVTLDLGRAGRITRDDEILTYVARNMERMRGFQSFMRALPDIQAARPQARALIVGGSDASYGAKSTAKGGFRAEMEDEVGARLDWDRIHFLGPVPYADYCRIVQISRCHVYLTAPFVLSWSLLEAMAMQATIVASDVAPVREAITHGETGLLVDMLRPDLLARQVVDVLSAPDRFAHLGPAARRDVVAEYDFLDICLPRHLSEINALLPADKAIRV